MVDEKVRMLSCSQNIHRFCNTILISENSESRFIEGDTVGGGEQI
jgi:hypothetical protein